MAMPAGLDAGGEAGLIFIERLVGFDIISPSLYSTYDCYRQYTIFILSRGYI